MAIKGRFENKMQDLRTKLRISWFKAASEANAEEEIVQKFKPLTDTWERRIVPRIVAANKQS